MPVAVGDRILSEIESQTIAGESEKGITFTNCLLAGPMPYRGGDITHFNGLYRVENGSLADSVFNLVTVITGNFGIDVSSYVNIGRLLSERLPSLLGIDSGDWRIGHYGPIYKESDSFFDRYLILIGEIGDPFDINSLEVHNNNSLESLRIRTKNGTKPFCCRDYSLIKLGSRLFRDDFTRFKFHKRFDESNILLRQAIAEGRLGDLRYITVEYSQRELIRGVFGAWLDRTNIFQYLGVHYVDIIFFLTGGRPVRALAMGQPDVGGSNATPGADSIQALIEWELPGSGERVVSTIITNWIDPDGTSAMSDQKITVVGTKGRYQMDQKHRGAQLVTQDGGVEDINPYFSQIYVGGDGQPGVHGYGPRCITQFLVDARDYSAGRIRQGDLNGKRPTFRDCLPSTAVIEAVNRSLTQHGEWIQIPDTGNQHRTKAPASGSNDGPAA